MHHSYPSDATYILQEYVYVYVNTSKSPEMIQEHDFPNSWNSLTFQCAFYNLLIITEQVAKCHALRPLSLTSPTHQIRQPTILWTALSKDESIQGRGQWLHSCPP